MTNKNKKEGTLLENLVCEHLYKYGFWAHCLTQNAVGQPFDIIAVKGERAVAIDAKDCKSGRFPLSRIEDNQHNAMLMWRFRGNGEGWFALRLDEEIYMFPYHFMESWEKKSLSSHDIKSFGIPFEGWVRAW